MKCDDCGQELICYCPYCQGRRGGISTSAKKVEASRINGAKGGRPKKNKTAKSKELKS